MTAHDQTAVLAAWADSLQRELELSASPDVDAVLDLAGAVAHAVVRPAAPLTTYLVGYAAGLAAAGGDNAGFDTAADVARALAARWRAPEL